MKSLATGICVNDTGASFLNFVLNGAMLRLSNWDGGLDQLPGPIPGFDSPRPVNMSLGGSDPINISGLQCFDSTRRTRGVVEVQREEVVF